MQERIEAFVRQKRVAVVGVSRNKRAFGNAAADELSARGYTVHRVNSHTDAIDGKPCVRQLDDLRGEVDSVLISVSPDRAVDVLDQASALGVQHIWLQQGSSSPEVIERARALHLAPVTGRCILMYAPPVSSFHGVHRTLSCAVGTLYPKNDPFAEPSGAKRPTPSAWPILLAVGLGVVGWALCGGIMYAAMALLSETGALIAHALLAPAVFALLGRAYFGRPGALSPAATALVFVGVVIGLDLIVVATLIERSYAMFASPLGTWIPFALIAATTWITGNLRSAKG